MLVSCFWVWRRGEKKRLREKGRVGEGRRREEGGKEIYSRGREESIVVELEYVLRMVYVIFWG